MTSMSTLGFMSQILTRYIPHTLNLLTLISLKLRPAIASSERLDPTAKTSFCQSSLRTTSRVALLAGVFQVLVSDRYRRLPMQLVTPLFRNVNSLR